jgi:hypothetical protein
LAVVGHRLTVGEALIRFGGVVEALSVTLPADRYPGVRVVSFQDQTASLDDAGMIADAGFVAAYVGSPEFVVAREAGDWRNLTVRTVLAEPVDVVAVPPSSIYGVDGDVGCVVDAVGPLAVKIVASELGETMVTGEVLPHRVSISPPSEAVPCS